MPGDPIPSPEREWRCRNDGTLLGVRRGDTVEVRYKSAAYVVRGEERIHVNLKRILKGKEADMQLQPGDRVVIPVSAL